jgi:uncharacterized protein with HEPN domain
MNRDRVHLLFIQRCIGNVQRLTQPGEADFRADEDKQASVLYYMQSLSEATKNISQELRDTQPQIAWVQIRGFRNRIAHDYLNVDLGLVWRIITVELEPLRAAVEAMLATLPPEPDEG